MPLVLMFSLVDIHPPLASSAPHRRRLLVPFLHARCFCSAVLTLQVYDGENTSSRLLGNFTRDDMLGHVINSTSNRLWLEFNSNASGTNQGFRLAYTSEFCWTNNFGSVDSSFLRYYAWVSDHDLFKCSQKSRSIPLASLSGTHTHKKKKAIERLIMKVLVMRCFKWRAGVSVSGLEVPSWIHLMSVVFTNFQDYSSSSSTLDICL